MRTERLDVGGLSIAVTMTSGTGIRRDASRLVPIFYSLGSLTNPFSAEFLRRSAVARIDLARGLWTDGSRRTYVSRAAMAEVEQVADDALGILALRPVEGSGTGNAIGASPVASVESWRG